MVYYHVCAQWDGANLQSLALQHPDRAAEIYLERWPDAGELVHYHIHYVHLYDSLDQARDHQRTYGGQILEVHIPDDEVDMWIELDSLEEALPHPVVRDEIPAHMIRIHPDDEEAR